MTYERDFNSRSSYLEHLKLNFNIVKTFLLFVMKTHIYSKVLSNIT